MTMNPVRSSSPLDLPQLFASPQSTPPKKTPIKILVENGRETARPERPTLFSTLLNESLGSSSDTPLRQSTRSLGLTECSSENSMYRSVTNLSLESSTPQSTQKPTVTGALTPSQRFRLACTPFLQERASASYSAPGTDNHSVVKLSSRFEEEPISPSATPVLSNLDSSSSTLDIEDIEHLVRHFQNSQQIHIPHTTVSRTVNALDTIVDRIASLSLQPFHAKAEHDCFTTISVLSSHPRKNWLTDPQDLHKVLFCVERVAQDQFALISLDTITSPTSRRFGQVARERLSCIAPDLTLLGLSPQEPRQKSLFGCGAFAIEDLLQYNKTPHLFPQLSQLPHREMGLDWSIQLPPEWMNTTQSFTALTDYISKLEQHVKTPKDLPLRLHLLYHDVMAHTTQSSQGKEINSYIAKRNAEFQALIAQKMLSVATSVPSEDGDKKGRE